MSGYLAPVINVECRRRRAHRLGNASSMRPCDCPTWGMLDRVRQDLILAGFMEWAWLLYKVRLKLLVHGTHVAIHHLGALRPGEGRVRHVMTELCLFADCARVVLELTPTDQYGADLVRLTRFYVGLGFETNEEPRTPFRYQGKMIRYPMQRRGHGKR